MGMLEMGITFSFQQLLIDSAIVGDTQRVLSLAKLPESVNDPTYVKNLVAAYRGDIPDSNTTATPKYWQDATDGRDIGKWAAAAAAEIINTHNVPSLDRPVLNQLHRIVLAAE